MELPLTILAAASHRPLGCRVRERAIRGSPRSTRRRQRRLFRRQRRQRLLKITCHRYRGPEPGGANIYNSMQTFKLVFTPEHRVEINPFDPQNDQQARAEHAPPDLVAVMPFYALGPHYPQVCKHV